MLSQAQGNNYQFGLLMSLETYLPDCAPNLYLAARKVRCIANSQYPNHSDSIQRHRHRLQMFSIICFELNIVEVADDNPNTRVITVNLRKCIVSFG